MCKGHRVADPQVFLASASSGDAQAAGSSADDAASFAISVGFPLHYRCLRCTRSMSAQCTVLQFELRHHCIIELLLFLLLLCSHAQWNVQRSFWLQQVCCILLYWYPPVGIRALYIVLEPA